MASSAITLQIALNGAGAVRAQLDALAAAGQRSMKLLADAGGAGAAGLASIGAAVARIKEASAAIGSVGVGTATAAGIESIGQAMKRTGEEFAGTEVAGQGLISLFDEFQRGQRDQMFATLGASIKRAGESWEGLTIGVVAATGAFFAFSKNAAEATRAIQDQAAALGTSLSHYEGLKYAAASLGIGQDVLATAMARFGDAAGRAKVQGERLAEAQQLHAGDAEELALKQNQLATSIEEAGLAAARSQREFVAASDAFTGVVANADRGVEAAQRALKRAKEDAFRRFGSAEPSMIPESIFGSEDDFGNPTPAVDAAIRAQNDAARRVRDAQHAVAEAEARAAQARQQMADRAEQLRVENEKRAEAEAQKRQENRQKAIEAEQHLHPVLRPGEGILQQAMGEIAPGPTGLPDMYRLLGTVADALDAMQDPAQRSAAAMHLFGEGWVKLDPLLRLGTAGLDRAAERFKSFGLDLTAADMAMAGAFNVSLGELGQVIESLKNQVGDQMAGAFAPFVAGLAAALVAGKDQIMAFASTMMSLFAPIATAIRQTASAIGQTANGIAAGLTDISSVAGGAVGPGSVLAVGLVLIAAAFSKVVAIIAVVSAGIWAFNAASKAIFGADTGLNAGAIIAIGAALYGLYRTFQMIRGIIAVISLENLLSSIERASGAVGAVANAFVMLAARVRGAVAAMLAFDIASWANPAGIAIAAVIAGLAALGVGIALMVTHWQNFKANISEFVSNAKGNLSGLAEWFKGTWAGEFISAIASIVSHSAAMLGVWGKVKGALEALGAWLKSSWLGQWISALGTTVGWIDRLLGKIGQLAKSLGKILGAGGGEAPGGTSGDAGTTGAAAASEPGAAYDNPIGGPSTAAGSGAASYSSSAAPSGGEADQGAGFAPAPSAADFAGADIIAGYQGHATGGEVHGPSGRDVIPARLTRGEFVNTVRAVRTLGTRFFHALNAAPERFAGLRDALGAARGFSLGGLVDNLSAGLSPAPLRLALGGPVDGRPASGGSRFTLVLDGQPHEVHGEDHVIGSIERYARRRQLLSAGRRATAVGGG